MRRRSHALRLLAIALLLVPRAVHAQGTRLLALDDLARLREVSDPQRSPDGAWVAYVVTSNDFATDKRDTDIWMVSWDGERQVRLTSSPESRVRPAVEPGRAFLAFTASRGEGGRNKKKGAQVWLLDRAGGEAQKLTDVKGGVSEYAWSPDGKRLVLVVDDPDPNDAPEKKEGRQAGDRSRPIVIDRYHFKQDRLGYLGALAHAPVSLRRRRRATEPLTAGVCDEASPAWSPDGQPIAFVSRRGPDPDRIDQQRHLGRRGEGGRRRRGSSRRPRNPDGGTPGVEPGRQVRSPICVGDEPRFYAYNQNRLAVVPVAGGAPRVLTESLDRRCRRPSGRRTARALFFLVEDDRAEYVARVPAGGGAIEPLTSGRRVVRELVDRTATVSVAVLAATAAEPFEVYALDGGQLRRLSAQNDEWLEAGAARQRRRLHRTGKDGTDVHGLAGQAGRLRRPDAGIRRCCASTAARTARTSTRSTSSASCSRPTATSCCGELSRQRRPRAKYQKAIFARLGQQGGRRPARRRGLRGREGHRRSRPARHRRLELRRHPDRTTRSRPTPRFKAAISGAGSSLQMSMYGTDSTSCSTSRSSGRRGRTQERGSKMSYPFFHADRIKTPTLFMGGEKDFNVPLPASEQMYQALAAWASTRSS